MQPSYYYSSNNPSAEFWIVCCGFLHPLGFLSLLLEHAQKLLFQSHTAWIFTENDIWSVVHNIYKMWIWILLVISILLKLHLHIKLVGFFHMFESHKDHRTPKPDRSIQCVHWKRKLVLLLLLLTKDINIGSRFLHAFITKTQFMLSVHMCHMRLIVL